MAQLNPLSRFFKEEYVEQVKEERFKYGVAISDTYNFHDYMGLVIANGLIMLAQDAHGWPSSEEFPEPEDWKNALLNVAEKLVQASTCSEQTAVVYNEIDWSDQPKFTPEEFDSWFEAETETPAFKEYSRRVGEIHELAQKNAEEAFDWLRKYWFALWD